VGVSSGKKSSTTEKKSHQYAISTRKIYPFFGGGGDVLGSGGSSGCWVLGEPVSSKEKKALLCETIERMEI